MHYCGKFCGDTSSFGRGVQATYIETYLILAVYKKDMMFWNQYSFFTIFENIIILCNNKKGLSSCFREYENTSPQNPYTFSKFFEIFYNGCLRIERISRVYVYGVFLTFEPPTPDYFTADGPPLPYFMVTNTQALHKLKNLKVGEGVYLLLLI